MPDEAEVQVEAALNISMAYREKWLAATKEIAALRAALAKCREALEPFAKSGAQYPASNDDSLPLHCGYCAGGELTIGTFRRAATALKETEGI